MSDLVRASFSIEKALYEKLETLVKKNSYTNRSEFLRDLIRDHLVEAEWDKNQETLGTVTLLYDHHVRKLSDKLTDLQHHHHSEILVSTHVHLDPHLCAEVIIIKGKASQIKKISDALRQQKGVLHSTLSMSSTGNSLG